MLDKSNAVDLPIWKFPVSIATLRRTLSPIVEPCIECASEEAKSIVGGPPSRIGTYDRRPAAKRKCLLWVQARVKNSCACCQPTHFGEVHSTIGCCVCFKRGSIRVAEGAFSLRLLGSRVFTRPGSKPRSERANVFRFAPKADSDAR
jgi:hypothetical protein